MFGAVVPSLIASIKILSDSFVVEPSVTFNELSRPPSPSITITLVEDFPEIAVPAASYSSSVVVSNL